MEPLLVYRRMLTWFCVFPVDRTTAKWKKLAHIVFCICAFIGNVIGILVSVAFFHKFFSTDLGSALYALFQIISLGSAVYAIVLILVIKLDIEKTFDNLSSIYNKYKNGNSFQYLDWANSTSELLWRMYSKFMMGGILSSHGTIAVICLLACWLIRGDFDANYSYHPYKTVLPWDQQKLVGYLAETFIAFYSAGAYLTTNGLLFTLFVSMCVQHLAFYKMFRHFVQEFDDPGEKRNDEELLCKLIEFHVITKDWFIESASIFSPYIVIQLITSMIMLAAATFQLDLQFQHTTVELGSLLLAIAVGLTNLFVYCYFGKLASESFEKMSDCLYESNWQRLPVNLQKYFILMIEIFQKSLYYHGFGIAVLNLETFCSLIQRVVTYYMMFKTLTE